jgi:hypothetical protein
LDFTELLLLEIVEQLPLAARMLQILPTIVGFLPETFDSGLDHLLFTLLMIDLGDIQLQFLGIDSLLLAILEIPVQMLCLAALSLKGILSRLLIAQGFSQLLAMLILNQLAVFQNRLQAKCLGHEINLPCGVVAVVNKFDPLRAGGNRIAGEPSTIPGQGAQFLQTCFQVDRLIHRLT